MSQASMIFNFRGEKIIINCTTTEKMRSICGRFASQINEDITNLFFKYNGNLINEELKFEEQANEKDKQLNSMNIIVEKENKSIINEKNVKLEENNNPDKIEDIKENKKDDNINKIINNNYVIAEININKYI